MNYSAITDNREMTICITVATKSKQKITLQVTDYHKPKTYFTDINEMVEGNKTFQVMMPLVPEKALISVFNANYGNLSHGKDDSFKVIAINKKPLLKKMSVVNVFSNKINGFIEFAERFSLWCSYLESGKSYKSDNGKYFIELLPTITNHGGKELNTPARTSKTTGHIQVSKTIFDTYTVPMRLVILLHEFSHFYINDDIDDESEADLNGLLIYLGLGYPKTEALEAWRDVFMAAKTQQNEQRYKIIEKFIQDFETQKITLK